MKLNKEAFNWYGLDHAQVNKKYQGEFTYVGTFCINGSHNPFAVYHVKNPRRDLGHKEYAAFFKDLVLNCMMITGFEKAQLEQWRYQDGRHCRKCDDVIYSIMRHDMRGCACGSIAIDGGRDYTRMTFSADADYQRVTIDLLTGEVKPQE